MPSRSIIRTGVGPHREPRNRFPAMAAAINLLAARAARVQSRRNLSRSLSPKLDHSHSITRFDRSRTGPYIGIASLMMVAGWSVLFIAWPYLVDQVSPPHRLLAERTWYGLRFAMPAGVGLLALAFVPRYHRRPVALAVAAACLACASLASVIELQLANVIELQRVDSQRGDMLLA